MRQAGGGQQLHAGSLWVQSGEVSRQHPFGVKRRAEPLEVVAPTDVGAHELASGLRRRDSVRTESRKIVLFKLRRRPAALSDGM